MIARAFSVVAVLSSIAGARPTGESTKANTDGQTLFKAGRYLESVPLFQRAYAIDPDPAYLFDIAQAYRLAHSCEEAVDYYDRFFAAVPNPPSADKIHGFRDSSAECAKTRAPVPVPVRVEPPRQPPPPPQPEAGEGRTTLRTAGLATIAVGLVAAGAGIYFSVHASSLSNDRANVCPDSCVWSQTKTDMVADLDARGASAQRWSAVSYAVAGAAITGGVVMYVLGRNAHATPLVAAAPQPGGALVFANLAF